MNGPLPIPPPPTGYVSKGPYIVSFEHVLDDRLISFQLESLTDALSIWFHPSVTIDMAGRPDRRIIVDARGVIVFGFVYRFGDMRPYVVTAEVLDELRRRGVKLPGFLAETADLEALWLRS